MKRLPFKKLAALLPQPKPRKPKTSLRVTASRLVPTAFEEDEEPTTKLSTAFVVVLVLHLVAVGGIYAFHSIKAHRREADGTALTTGSSAKKMPSPVVPVHKAEARPPMMEKATGIGASENVAQKNTNSSVSNFAPTPAPAQAKGPAGVPAGGTLEKNTGPSAVLPQPKTPAVSPAMVTPANKSMSTPASGGDGVQRTYVVKRGDNPWSIAKMQGVSYDELMKINGLEDPKKLQLNQILKLPPKKSGN